MEEPCKITRPNAYDAAGFWSRLSLWWIIPLFNRGFHKDLEPDDLFACSTEDDPKIYADALER